MNTWTRTLLLCLMLCATRGLAGQAASVDLDFGGGAGGNVLDVLATGVGKDPEQARQNAFVQAIEQAVGVLVEAETLVRNDAIVREQILTYSRAYVESFEPVSAWEKDGLHYARIRAKVAATKLADKLKATKVAVRDVPGELFYRRARAELDSAEAALKMFRGALAEFHLPDLVDVEIVGKPEVVEKDQTQAKLKVKLKLTSDMDAWKAVHTRFDGLLRRIAPKHETVTYSISRGSGRFSADSLGAVTKVVLFKDAAPGGTTSRWEAYAVPATFKAEMMDRSTVHLRARLAIAFLDAAGDTIKSVQVPLGGARQQVSLITYHLKGRHTLGPLLYRNRSWVFKPTIVQEETIPVELDKLRHIAKCAVAIEEVTEK